MSMICGSLLLFILMDSLKSEGAELSYYDPHIPKIPTTREHKEWTGLESISWEEEHHFPI